ncbi:MAG: mitofilin family membrane protein, partial [Sphingomonadales bacterium]
AISGAGERLTALEEKLANGAPLAGPASGPADPALARALKDSIEELATRLAGIERQQLAAAKSGSIGLAASLLAEKTRSGRSFRVELLSVEVLSEVLTSTEQRTVSDLLVRLSPFARKGVASIPELRKSFTPLIKSALKASGISTDTDWLQNSWAEVRGLIVIRRTGNVEGDTVAAHLARAEYKLGEEDLAGAMVEVKALEAKSREVFKAWLEVAATHTMVSKTAAELEDFLELDSGGRE